MGKLHDGKPVKNFLFARKSRIAQNGCVPCDDKRHFIVLAQVEAISKDHAINRLQNDLFPMIPRNDWDLIEELDAEHDVGALGSKHPLNPLEIPFVKRVQ